MYRVVIVDDEPWVLKGIRNTFKWEELGFQVIAETTDPLFAFEIIREQKPDVVMTDIRMPEISGIDLMRMSRKQGVCSEFIIISGVADFHYAQESMRLGCFDYLLKPLQFEEADALLERLFHHLEHACRHKDMELLDAVQQENGVRIKQLLENRGFKSKSNHFHAVFISSGFKELLAQSLEWIKDEEHLVIKADPNRVILLMGCCESKYSFLLKKVEAANLQDRLVIGVSKLSACSRDIPKLIEEAHMALQSSFIYSVGGVFMNNVENRDVIRKSVRDICTTIHQHSGEKVSLLLNEIPELFRKERAGIKEVTFFWNQLVSAFGHKHGEGAFPEELHFMDYGALVNKFSDLEDLCMYLKRFVKPNEEAMFQEQGLPMNENFKELLEYVNAHYEDELQLKELANKFFINFTYCCDLFRKITNTTFTEYVTRLRMKKAEHLLKESNMTISEICEKVGYKDYYYFNKVFKKCNGITPSTYRKQQTIGYAT